MKYPKQNRYLKIKRVGTDQVEITNMLTGEVWKTDWEYARLLRALDGKTHPYHIYESMDRESVKGLIRDFKECGFLDNKKRVYPQGLGSVLFILWSPRIKKIDRLLAALWNRLLLWTWLPVFFYGVHILFEKEYPYVTGNQQPGGFLLLMLLGLVFHEFSHTCACLSYGGDFYCTGLTLQNFLPGAFVMIDYDDVKGRFRRVQINAAGIETNVLLRPLLTKGLHLVGSMLRNRTPEFKAYILAELVKNVWPKIEDGSIQPSIYRVLPITEAEAAHAILERGENVGKVVLRVCDEEA